MTMEFAVETGFPVPVKKARSKYGFDRLAVGQSIFVPGEKEWGAAHEAARKYARRRGLEFVCREVDGGLRVWRT